MRWINDNVIFIPHNIIDAFRRGSFGNNTAMDQYVYNNHNMVVLDDFSRNELSTLPDYSTGENSRLAFSVVVRVVNALDNQHLHMHHIID